MRILWDNIWQEAILLGVGSPEGTLLPAYVLGDNAVIPGPDPDPDPDPDPEPPPYTETAFHSSGTFQPILMAPSNANIVWLDAATRDEVATGLTPTLGSGVWLITGDVNLVHTVNLGFNSAEDAGRYNLGSSYNYSPRQPIVQVENLSNMTGLVRFLAACPTLRGHLDFSGLSLLEYVELYRAQVSSADLTGCSSVIRLCFEQNDLSYLDLTPVRNTLRDFRGAGQNRPGVVYVCAGDLPVLYHYCTRGNPGCVQIPVEQMPLVEQWWVYNSSMTSTGSPVSPILNSLRAYGNHLNEASVDRLLLWVADDVTRTNGTVRLEGGTNAPPSVAGEAAVTRILAKGIGVQTN